MRVFIFSLLLASAITPAHAQETERFTLEKTEDGYVRLNTETGAMSLCEERSGQLVCRMATEDRAAFEDELAALNARVEALEEKLGTGTFGLPSEEDLDRTFGIMERFFKRFMGIMRDLDEEPDKDLQKTAS